MNQQALPSKKLSTQYQRSKNQRNSDINQICNPTKPPIYYNYQCHTQSKFKQNIMAFQNYRQYYRNEQIEDRQKTKVKHDKFKMIAQKNQYQAKHIYRKLKSQQQGLEAPKPKYVYSKRENKNPKKLKENLKQYHYQKGQKNKFQYQTLTNISNMKHNHKTETLEATNLDETLLCCDEDLTKNDWAQKTRRTFNIEKPILDKAIKNIRKKTPQQQIQQFQTEIPNIDALFENQALALDIQRQYQYFETPNYNCYLQRRQFNLSWIRRAVVLDWMMEALTEFGSKRQTFAKAVSMLDRYLASTINVPLQQLQLIGATCMLIANKLEDYVFSLQNLHDLISQLYTINQIQQMQTQILTKLGWKINPPTPNSWANRLATQWDLYLQASQTIKNYDIVYDNLNIIKFKVSDNDSYYNYRWLMQYIDFSILDIHTLQYQGRTLAASFIYLVLLQRLKLYSKEKIVEEFPTSSQYLINDAMDDTKFNIFFNQFLTFSFNIKLTDLLPTIQYCATFIILQLNFDLPQAVKNNEEAQLHYEQFCSYQTKNKSNTLYLQRRNRKYD